MSKLTDLAMLLLEKTSENKIPWEAVDAKEITAYVGQTSIKMAVGRSYTTGLEEVTLSLSNIDGFKLDEEVFGPQSMYGAEVMDLYHRARRSALRTDETIDGLIESLRQR